jgi:NADPH-dependent 2,4-dienoyl-CoA reductase/sulfur reductase-like enzyme
MGVFTDRWLRTNARDVYAAGDVAIHAHPRYGHLRVEHWANARDQGAAAARSMLGNQDVFDRIPYFFSDQYNLGLEYVGRASPVAELVIRGDLASREFIAFWHDRGRIVAGMNVNVWDAAPDIEALIDSQVPVDLEALVDPSVPLGCLLGERRVA